MSERPAPDKFLEVVAVRVKRSGMLYQSQQQRNGTWKCGACGRGIILPLSGDKCRVCGAVAEITKAVNDRAYRAAVDHWHRMGARQ